MGYKINLYNEVLNKAHIIDVLDYYGIKVSSNKALCPFHNDNHPSLSVNKQKNIAMCFSCGTGGNVISFVQKYEKLINGNEISINQAISKLKDICNLDIDTSSINKRIYDNQFTLPTKRYTDEEKRLIEVNTFHGECLPGYTKYFLDLNLGKFVVGFLKNIIYALIKLRELCCKLVDSISFKKLFSCLICLSKVLINLILSLY